MNDPTDRMPNLAEDWLPRNPWVVAGAVILAPFMEVLDSSIANVALPHIAGSLSATVDESTWVLTSYLVSNAIVLPLSGWFSTLIGRKRFYIGCVMLFTVNSFLCGLASNIQSIILFRVLQGAGGGALVPIAQSILVESFPPNKRGMAMAMFGMCVIVAPIIGPTLGGWITDNYTWRWVFFINIPVGMLAVFLATLLVKDPPYFVRKKFGEGFRIDYIGLGLIAVGLGALQIVLDKGQREDWFGSNFIVLLSIISLVCLVSVVLWELRQKDPIIKLSLLKDRNFAVGVFMMYSLGFALYGSTVLLPIFLQNLLGYNALTSGLALSPGGIVTMCTMPIVGFLMMRLQARWLIIVGLIIGSAGLFRMANFNLQISYTNVVWARIILSAGLGFLFVPINTSAYYYIAKTETDYASGLINLARNLGGSAGISFVTTMLARRAQFHQNILVSHVTESDPTYLKILHGASEILIRQGANAVEATAKANALIYGMVRRQASMLAFTDDFWVLGIIFIMMIPLVFLMKKTAPRREAVAVH
jgi:DHA2 family multidrug resistance protein